MGRWMSHLVPRRRVLEENGLAPAAAAAASAAAPLRQSRPVAAPTLSGVALQTPTSTASLAPSRGWEGAPLAIAGQLRKCSNVQLHASGMTENVARLSSGYIKYFLRDGNGNRKY